MSVAVVVPTIREACLARFLAEWADDLAGVRLIVGEDNPERTFPTPAGVEHYCWADVEQVLGETAWIRTTIADYTARIICIHCKSIKFYFCIYLCNLFKFVISSNKYKSNTLFFSSFGKLFVFS